MRFDFRFALVWIVVAMASLVFWLWALGGIRTCLMNRI